VCQRSRLDVFAARAVVTVEAKFASSPSAAASSSRVSRAPGADPMTAWICAVIPAVFGW
jgi:hypothetical protein